MTPAIAAFVCRVRRGEDREARAFGDADKDGLLAGCFRREVRQDLVIAGFLFGAQRRAREVKLDR